MALRLELLSVEAEKRTLEWRLHLSWQLHWQGQFSLWIIINLFIHEWLFWIEDEIIERKTYRRINFLFTDMETCKRSKIVCLLLFSETFDTYAHLVAI